MKMTKRKYGITKATYLLPTRDLLRVPHKGKILVVSSPAFGDNTYSANLEEMSKLYFHSKELPKISFREPTTSESISVAVYDFKKTKKEIFERGGLQLGTIVGTLEGVFVNPLKDTQGNTIIDEEALKSLLNKSCKKINGIYLGKNDFGFAPYETFKQGMQASEDFTEGGLARVLEHTEKKVAKNLKKISFSNFDHKNNPTKYGVEVFEFNTYEIERPDLKIISLASGEGLKYPLFVDAKNNDESFVFGVLNKIPKSI